MHKTKTLLLTGILSLFSAAAFAAPVPSEIYKPIGARTVKAHHQGSGEFEYEAELPGKRISIPSLAEKVIAYARSHGFQIVESKFKRGNQELDVSIEDKGHRIEYKADLDLDNH